MKDPKIVPQSFWRTKVVTGWLNGTGVLKLKGLLEDDIYGLEVLMAVDLASKEVLSVEAKWIRMENSQCWRAIPAVNEVVGQRISPEGEAWLQKTVGRKGCRHLADLLWECFDVALNLSDELEQRQIEDRFSIEVKDLFGKGAEEYDWPHVRDLPSVGERTLLDLHVHTFPASPCSSISVEEAVKEAKKKLLDGICLTDHNHIWTRDELDSLRQRHGYLILGGSEITTDHGDILVYYHPDLGPMLGAIKGMIPLKALKEMVGDKAFLAVAHPFRGFLTFGVGLLDLTVEEASKREVFKWVEGIEVLNAKVGRPENLFASKVASNTKLRPIAGSDAHLPQEIGYFATMFTGKVQDEEDLLDLLRTGEYTPVRVS